MTGTNPDPTCYDFGLIRQNANGWNIHCSNLNHWCFEKSTFNGVQCVPELDPQAELCESCAESGAFNNIYMPDGSYNPDPKRLREAVIALLKNPDCYSVTTIVPKYAIGGANLTYNQRINKFCRGVIGPLGLTYGMNGTVTVIINSGSNDNPFMINNLTTTCGNGIFDEGLGEKCDPTVSYTVQKQCTQIDAKIFSSGVAVCNSNCQYDVSMCEFY